MGQRNSKHSYLWKLIFIGLYAFCLLFIGRRKPKNKQQAPSETSLSEVILRLDKIERKVEQSSVGAVKLWILAVAIALIIATPTVITNNISLGVLMFCLGVIMIFFAARYKRK